MLLGFNVIDDKLTAGSRVVIKSEAVLDTPLYEADKVTDVLEETTVVVTAKVAAVAPDATVTDAGTPAVAALLLESATTTPPDGAAPDRVTVP